MKNKITIVGLIAVVVAGVALFMLFGGGSDTKNVTDEMMMEEMNEANSEDAGAMLDAIGVGSIAGLMARGENLECTIIYKNSEADGGESKGTMFTSRDRMRGDFEAVNEGEKTVGSMIINDNIMYSWSEIDGEKFGMKVDLAELKEYQTSAGEAAVETREPVGMEEEVNFDCKRWSNVDGSVFEPPSDVIFRDFGDVINTGMEFGNIYEGGPGGEFDQCGMCEMIPAGTDRDECLASFGCE